MTLFTLADRFMEQGDTERARHYLEKGIAAHPWALDCQLLYAEAFCAKDDEARVQEIAKLVLEHAEEDDMINRARVR